MLGRSWEPGKAGLFLVRFSAKPMSTVGARHTEATAGCPEQKHGPKKV